MQKRSKNKKNRPRKEAALKYPAPVRKSQKSKMDRQLKYVLIVMVLVILLAIGVYYFVQSMKKFNYAGLEFEKVMYDRLPVYHSKIPITNTQGELVANYNLFLRNDPRALKSIAIDGKIRLMKDTFVSIEPEADGGCEDSGIAGGNFFTFLKVAGVDAKLACTNNTYASERNITYATCQEHLNNSGVIIIKRGESTEIVKKSDDCYEISFRNCEILNVTERFIVGAIANSKGIEL